MGSPLEGDLRGLIETSGVPLGGGLSGEAGEVAEAPSGRSSGLFRTLLGCLRRVFRSTS